MSGWQNVTFKHYLDLFIVSLKHQLKDRLQTTSYVIGISAQPVALSFVASQNASSLSDAYTLFSRITLVNVLTIVLFSAKANINNEFVFKTIEHLFFGKFRLEQIFLIRSMANAVLVLPALIIPYVVFVLQFGPRAEFAISFVMILAYVPFLAYQCTLVINSTSNPDGRILWVRYLVVFVALGTLPLGVLSPAAWLFPTFWITGHDLAALQRIALTVLTIGLNHVLVRIFFRQLTVTKMNRFIERGKVA